MFDLLAEGFESALLPCSLVLLVSGLGVGLAAVRRSTLALFAYGTMVVITGWLRFSGRTGTLVGLAIAIVLAMSTVALASGLNLGDRPSKQSGPALAMAGGGLAGIGTASLWVPCVGSAFGDLLGELSARAGSGLALFTIFCAGLLSPLVLLGALLRLLPVRLAESLKLRLAIVGLGAIGLSAGATALGLHDDLISQLVSWSI